MSAELEHLPGFHIRRLQQIAVAVFLEETQAFGITPVQYAALAAVRHQSGIDQRTLARIIGFDPSTIGSVIDRLETRGLMQRNANVDDRRVRQLTLTDAGVCLMRDVEPSMLRAQARMLEPLPPAQRAQFMDMLCTLVDGNNALSRAPSLLVGRASNGRAQDARAPKAQTLAGKTANHPPTPSTSS